MLKYMALLLISCIHLSAETSQSCIQFSVVIQDTLKNLKQGLSPDDQKWFREKVEKKNPSVCYVDPSPTVPLVFVVIITSQQGTRIVTNTSTQSNPIRGTVTDQDGNTADISATQETTTTSSTAVPHSEGVYTLSVEQRQSDGSYRTLQRFSQVPYTFLGRNPVRPIIEEAVKWISRGGLAEQERLAARPLVPAVTKPAAALSTDAGNDAGGPTAPSSNAPPGLDAVLDISSTPTGAEIDIDGAYVGNTPASVDLAPGEHAFKITKKGFVPWERRLKAMPGHASVSPELETVETGKSN